MADEWNEDAVCSIPNTHEQKKFSSWNGKDRSDSSSFDSKSCFKCHKEGHMARDCPNGEGVKPKTCFKCKEEGHMSRECPNGDSNDSKPKTCFKCKEEGHMSRECPNADSNDSKPKSCFKCKEEGHFSRECPNADVNGPRTCYKCKKEGHISSECPDGGSSSECFKCHEEGHMARDCPKPDDPDKPPAQTYIPVELDEDELFVQGVTAGINFSSYDNIPVESTGENIPIPVTRFEDCGLRKLLLENISKAKYLKPTPIQKHSLPIIMKGRDLMACAQTGSGKTAAFLLPILHYVLENAADDHAMEESVKPTGVILSPTRELAIQIYNEARKFSNGSCIKVCIAYGGTAVGAQIKNMQRGCHLLVATPGRLMDFVERNRVSFEDLKFFVLDEADRMLDLGFGESVKKIVEHSTTPKIEDRQTLMFSATFQSDVQELAKKYLNNYIFTVVGMVGAANADVKQVIENVPDNEKREKLLAFLQSHLEENSANKILVFVKTKKMADFLACYLSTQKVSTTSIHGDRFQNQREEALSQFKTGIRNVLVATAVAARGLDIKDVGCVVNFDMPDDIDEYVHRIGRTGRVGNRGLAISYFDTDLNNSIGKDLIKILKDADQEVPEWLVTCANSSFGGGYGGAKGYGTKDIRGSFKSHDESSAAPAFGGSSGQATAGNFQDEEDWG